MFRIVFVILLLLAVGSAPLRAAEVNRTYAYFPIGGRTLPEIERQLQMNGPQLSGTGERHPGATTMRVTVRVDYAETARHCRIGDANATVDATVQLPRWRDRGRAQADVRLIWDTLADDIKRHEESHLSIAKSHARILEDTLKNLSWQRDCRVLAQRVDETTAEILARHDAAQARFDRIETINFESRLMRLLRYRLEQIEEGRLSP